MTLHRATDMRVGLLALTRWSAGIVALADLIRPLGVGREHQRCAVVVLFDAFAFCC